MSNTTSHTFTVPDISCQHCIDAINEQVSAVEGVLSVEVDLASKLVSVNGGSADALVAAIDEAGYDASPS